MQVSLSNGWTFDTEARTIAWPDVAPARPLPDVSHGALMRFGAGYLSSQAAARTVNDTFRRRALEILRASNPAAKLSDVGKEAVPAADSEEYRAELQAAQEAIFAKLVNGYVVGAREGGSSDPVAEESDKLARMWLQGLAVQFRHNGRPWYTLPAKKKVAADSDAYDGPGYETFGDALDAFKVSVKPVSPKLTGKTPAGAAWPWKIKPGSTVADAILHEAQRRVAERESGKAGVTLGSGGDNEEVDF